MRLHATVTIVFLLVGVALLGVAVHAWTQSWEWGWWLLLAFFMLGSAANRAG